MSHWTDREGRVCRIKLDKTHPTLALEMAETGTKGIRVREEQYVETLGLFLPTFFCYSFLGLLKENKRQKEGPLSLLQRAECGAFRTSCAEFHTVWKTTGIGWAVIVWPNFWNAAPLRAVRVIDIEFRVVWSACRSK